MHTTTPLRGVNLGGWLLLEKWITPSLFTGLGAKDEYSLCLENPEEASQRLARHRETFITKEDFKWLAAHNINAVRIPIGYWALQDAPPFLQYADTLDQAFAWAHEYNLRVVLDLHGAPGSQSGRDHSGRIGPTKWKRRANVKRTLEAMEQLCKRYGSQQALWGVELLNEPGWKIAPRTLRRYYDRAYDIVRRYCSESTVVILNDIFRPLAWNNFMANPKYQNLAFDLHLYQCFTPWDKALSLEGHLQKAHRKWSSMIQHINQPVIVGEWSLGLDPKTFRGMDDQQRKSAQEAYATAQMDVFKHTAGWFFWTYKTEDMQGWNFRGCVEAGIITV